MQIIPQGLRFPVMHTIHKIQANPSAIKGNPGDVNFFTIYMYFNGKLAHLPSMPFFTTKTGGTGIGLSLSKQIMHRHGGTLSVISQPDVETWFTLTF